MILQKLKNKANDLVKSHINKFPDTQIEIKTINQYPSLNTSKNAGVINFVKSLTGNNSVGKVSFGTEGGIFSKELDLETAICGPGSMEQGHKPDEYIEKSQINLCDQMLDNLLEKLRFGI